MGNPATAEQAEAAAQAAWPALANAAGLDPAGYDVSILRTRVQRGEARTLLLVQAEGRPSLILKHAEGEADGWFESQIAAHRRAHEIFADAPGLTVPDLLAVDTDRRAMLMEHVAGQTAHDAIAQAPDAAMRLDILRACARWAGHLHRGGEVKFGRVRPDRALRQMAEWRASVTGGEVRIPDRDRFLSLLDRVTAHAEAARDRKTTRVAVHGDLSLRNVMVGPDGVTGIDFGTTGLQSPAADLARLLVMYATFFGPSAQAGAPDDLAAARAAVLGAHAGRWRDGVELTHLLGVDVLRIWLSIPPHRWSRGATKQRRWRGISAIADALLTD